MMFQRRGLSLLLLICTGVAHALITGSSLSTTRRFALSSRHRKKWTYQEDDREQQHVKETDRPTLTRTQLSPPDLIPSQPKIVVLGASGKIGRLVVQQLLELSMDATIVALVRDYDKACRVLYDDMVVARRKRTKCPQLQIVQADLVPPEELPRFGNDSQHEHEEWLRRASSAASFYGTSVSDYDDDDDDGDDEPSGNEALREAIRDCTTIISCVGSVRPTNLWTDFLARPLLRILQRDVRDWCNDPRHPYYVNYASTRKALAYAEQEQKRREAAVGQEEEQNRHNGDSSKPVPRIRFIRISDLCVAQQPWQFVPLLTNVFHSMVFRYQEMTERLLESSSLIETVVVRPGDLCDDERNVNTTFVQVDPSGKVPLPSRVGREDVATLVMASALFQTRAQEQGRDEQQQPRSPPFHYTLAVRWAGEQLDPYPAQGKMCHGLPDAKLGLQSALRILRKQEKRERQRALRRTKSSRRQQALAPFLPIAKRRLKPYGVCVAVPVYMTMFLLIRSLCQSVCPAHIPSWMVPVATRTSEIVTVVTSFCVGRLGALVHRLPVLWKSLTGRAAQKYISF